MKVGAEVEKVVGVYTQVKMGQQDILMGWIGPGREKKKRDLKIGN